MNADGETVDDVVALAAGDDVTCAASYRFVARAPALIDIPARPEVNDPTARRSSSVLPGRSELFSDGPGRIPWGSCPL